MVPLHFHGLNYYSKDPQRLFDFYQTIGLRVVQEKESDPFLGQQIPDPFSEEPPLKVFSFRTIDAVCALCASLPSGLRLESSLYKNPNSGQFLLLLKAAGNLPDYQSACAMACEHGTLQKTGSNPLPYFREHYTAVIPNGAVEALQLI